MHDFEIHGLKASAFIDLGFPGREESATIIYGDGASIYSAAAAGVNTTNVEVLTAKDIAGGNENYQYLGYKSEDIDFINAILEGRQPLCTIEDAAKSMDLMEMIVNNRIN